MHINTRRRFLSAASAIGFGNLLGLSNARAEPPPEITRVRLAHSPAICLATTYLAEDLLHLEGISQVDYVEILDEDMSHAIRDGKADFCQDTAPAVLPVLDHSRAITVLGGIHSGCYELFGNERVSRLRDLQGKSIGMMGIGAAEHVFISSILSYVGLDPRRDVKWITTGTWDGSMQLFLEGKTDAVLGFAPQPQELRRKQIGHVILDTAQDRPWSQYFCCLVVGNRTFVEKYPVATKKVLRAYLKAADICAQEPEKVARYLVSRGFEPRYEIGLEVLKSLPYTRWRDSNPEDTLRFHALRLYEVSMIKSTPQQLIAQGTNWRFLKELRKQLKV